MPNFPQICPQNVTSISTTVVEDLKFSFDKYNYKVVCKLEVTDYSQSKLKKVVVVSRGSNLEFKLGLVFGWNLHSNLLRMTICYPCSKDIPTEINSQILKSLLCDFFFGKLCMLRQQCHNCTPSTWICTH